MKMICMNTEVQLAVNETFLLFLVSKQYFDY